MATTSFGTGQLLLEAAKLPGIGRILLGIGGSATVDGGIGAAQACGLPVILDGVGPADMVEPLVGEDLARVVLVKHARGSPIDRVHITVASDVTNPLFGPHGAARVFGPQKGATPEQVEQLDALLKRLAERCDKLAEAETPGAGAAGGMGFAMLAFFHAELKPGFDIVADAVQLRDRLKNANLCLTGEGQLDRSSLSGKAAVGVGRLCRVLHIRCAAVVGSRADDLRNDSPFDGVYPLQAGDVSPEESMRNARELIAQRSAQAAREITTAPG
jgi:glycerate kinase